MYGNTVFRAVVMLCCVSALVLCFVQLLEREKQFLEAVCKFFKRRCSPFTIFKPNNELQSRLHYILGLSRCLLHYYFIRSVADRLHMLRTPPCPSRLLYSPDSLGLGYSQVVSTVEQSIPPAVKLNHIA